MTTPSPSSSATPQLAETTQLNRLNDGDLKRTEEDPKSTNNVNVGAGPVEKQNEKERPSQTAYSVFTRREKWFIVVTIAFAGLLSPFTANIYFPAIPVLVADFHKSTELINLTVTVYMILQGISPMFWATIADRIGRRPIFLACMIVLTLSCVGLALVPTSDYWLLLVLRCIQAAGSASTIALGAGVVADIAVPAERGSFFGFFNIGPMIGPAIGPVVGGALSDAFGWRSIFWFLCILSAVCGVTLLLFLPETLRALVGDGSIPPPRLNKALIPFIGRTQRRALRALNSNNPPSRAHKPLSNPFVLLTYPDVLTLLVFTGIFYAVCMSINASISTLFESAYPWLSQTEIGLCYLSVGGGMLLSSVGTGRMLDWDYRRVKDKIEKLREARRVERGDIEEKGMDSDEEGDIRDDFPIEKARLRTMPLYSFFFIAVTLGYGWCVQAKVSIAGPLILQFLLGYLFNAIMNTTSTLLIDLVPTQGSSITACNNIVRCFLGAAVMSVINMILDALKPGWTHVLLAGLCIAVCPLLYVEMRWGPVWRERRRTRLALRESSTKSSGS
ncbi:MFS general substrate transporter [Stereum hirsutum FP-91666 SS1]|uniref:MFS general substrate transporter n=1 Tax=Stereum hirsutum (strain FP-91666) TaxID=721885 RepID=UPI00044101A7|nr:MFS general substrate transporter [Stereum hirsutum FP-91666 SS1]EIM87227.1 MFS general substrate transporter [Stereum hirsutum FP-91666 SS1]